MNTYFTADTHFGQERTRLLHNRPFQNIFEMDTTIIENWNRCVADDDTVYHLGDYGNPECLHRLKGNIFFLPSQDYDTQEVVSALQHRCQIIEPNTVITLNDESFQLVHEPLTAIPSPYFFIFGHIHRFQMIKRNGLCVSTDAHWFTPLSLEGVLFYKNAIEYHYDENVFIEYLGKERDATTTTNQ